MLTVVKQIAVGVLGGLDGLTAMAPDGDYLQDFLNRPSSALSATYRAIASNFEPHSEAGLARFARDRLTDLVFSNHPNDLIVPTEGVYTANGASGFPIADPLVFRAEDAIDHSSYWDTPRTLQAFDTWLARDTSSDDASRSTG